MAVTTPDHRAPSEVRFRVRAANSAPRRIRVIALTNDDAEVRRCAERTERTHADVQFVHASELAALLQTEGADAASILRSVDANASALNAWLGTPDLVVIAGREGDDAQAGAVAAQAYRSRGVTVSGVIGPCGHRRESARTADLLRPHCTMLILPVSAGYLEDLLAALGA
ncbi:hypothetical protein [Caballeronia insecticola]|uniref:Uncharacterized protein n=1 Tax=Caballeronia insecticola TaxID=758793 RepID=R4X4G5_9BURK|nr:hypothetical protein [Caballeronia insecticola]BAN27277.1 hypothetical protein BRPE64_DCDS03410 [Caballeronia insecticola]